MITFNKIDAWADRLIRLSAFIGTSALLAEVLIILVDVIGRAFGAPLYGSQDLGTMAFVIIVFAGMALSDKMGGQIAVDLFEQAMGDRLNKIINILVAIMGCVIFLALAYAVYDSAKISVMLNLQTNLLGLQKVWFQWALCAFALLTALGHLLRTVTLTRRWLGYSEWN